MTTKQISIFLENRPGALSELCKVLEAESVSMRAMCLAEAEDFGILRIIVDDPYNTATILRDHGYINKLTKVLTIEIEDKPGALIEALDILSGEGVNLEYSYAFLSRKEDRAYMVMRVANTTKAVEKLQGKGINIICQDDLADLFKE